MKRFPMAVIVAILAFTPLAFAQTKSGSSAATVEAQLKKFDHDWLDAEKRLDVAYCEKYFADGYVLVFPNGQAYTKKEWLDILRGPDHPTITFLDPEDIKVHLFPPPPLPPRALLGARPGTHSPRRDRS